MPCVDVVYVQYTCSTGVYLYSQVLCRVLPAPHSLCCVLNRNTESSRLDSQVTEQKNLRRTPHSAAPTRQPIEYIRYTFIYADTQYIFINTHLTPVKSIRTLHTHSPVCRQSHTRSVVLQNFSSVPAWSQPHAKHAG